MVSFSFYVTFQRHLVAIIALRWHFTPSAQQTTLPNGAQRVQPQRTCDAFAYVWLLAKNIKISQKKVKSYSVCVSFVFLRVLFAPPTGKATLRRPPRFDQTAFVCNREVRRRRITSVRCCSARVCVFFVDPKSAVIIVTGRHHRHRKPFRPVRSHIHTHKSKHASLRCVLDFCVWNLEFLDVAFSSLLCGQANLSSPWFIRAGNKENST